MPETGTDTQTEETKSQEAQAAKEKEARDAEEARATGKPPEPPPPAEGGDSWERKYKGQQRHLNDILKHLGVRNPAEVLSTDFSTPAKAGEKPGKAEPGPAAPLGDAPKMPNRADFEDEFEVLDEPRFREATEQYHRDVATHVFRGEQAEGLAKAETAALAEEVAELPGYLLGEEANRDENRGLYTVLIRGMAWHENGGKPASSAELRASRERIQALVGGSVTARLAELEKEATGAKDGEPPASQAAPPAKGDGAGAKKPPDWDKWDEPARIAWMVDPKRQESRSAP